MVNGDFVGNLMLGSHGDTYGFHDQLDDWMAGQPGTQLRLSSPGSLGSASPCLAETKNCTISKWPSKAASPRAVGPWAAVARLAPKVMSNPKMWHTSFMKFTPVEI